MYLINVIFFSLFLSSISHGITLSEERTEGLLRAERDVKERNRTLDHGSGLARAIRVIAKSTEKGRLVMLMCNPHCPKAKRLIPEWIRSFNDMKEYNILERVGYYYYINKHPLPFMNETEEIRNPALAFLIGHEVFYYDGKISEKEEVLDWLDQMDTADIIAPETHDELDDLLNMNNCSDKFLVYAPERGCEIPQWKSISRLVRLKMNIKTIYLKRPMPHDMATVFYRRLPLMNEHDCMFMTFIQLHSYSLPLSVTTPSEVLDRLSEVTTENECVMIDDGRWMPLKSPLTDLQMEYYSGERRLFHFERGTAYLVVGATSGVAVVALAISIFWGLNGSAFASK